MVRRTIIAFMRNLHGAVGRKRRFAVRAQMASSGPATTAKRGGGTVLLARGGAADRFAQPAMGLVGVDPAMP